MRYGEFRRRMEAEFACRSGLAGQAGSHRMYFLARTVNGTVYERVVVFEDDEYIPPRAIRSICSDLKVNPSVFGLAELLVESASGTLL